MSENEKIISFEDYEKGGIDSPYRLVILAARKAKEIIRIAKTQGKILEMKPTEIALNELANGKEEENVALLEADAAEEKQEQT